MLKPILHIRKLLLSLSVVFHSQINGDNHVIWKARNVLTWQEWGFGRKVLVGVDNIQTNRASIHNSDIGNEGKRKKLVIVILSLF